MSRRSRAAAGSRQGRNATTAAAWKGEQRRKRGTEASRDAIHTIGDARRASVYRDDVPFAAEDKPMPLPCKGTPERAALAREVAAMKASGMSHLRVDGARQPYVWFTDTPHQTREPEMVRTELVSKLNAQSLSRGDRFYQDDQLLELTANPAMVGSGTGQLVQLYYRDLTPGALQPERVWRMVKPVNTPMDRLVGARPSHS